MKCSIILHFFRVYTVLKVKKDLQTKEYNVFLINMTLPRYVQWTIPSLLYQTRKKNPLVYKGLNIIITLTVLNLDISCFENSIDSNANKCTAASLLDSTWEIHEILTHLAYRSNAKNVLYKTI